MWKAGTELQRLTQLQLQLAREFHRVGPVMLKKLQSFCNSWDKDIQAHHGIWCRSVQIHLHVDFVDVR